MTLHELSDAVFSVKDKLTDGEFKLIMDSTKKVFDEKQKPTFDEESYKKQIRTLNNSLKAHINVRRMHGLNFDEAFKTTVIEDLRKFAETVEYTDNRKKKLNIAITEFDESYPKFTGKMIIWHTHTREREGYLPDSFMMYMYFHCYENFEDPYQDIDSIDVDEGDDTDDDTDDEWF